MEYLLCNLVGGAAEIVSLLWHVDESKPKTKHESKAAAQFSALLEPSSLIKPLALIGS